MIRWRTLLRYDWPLHFILLLTNWLPDNVIFLRLRGFLSRPFFSSCGHTLNIGRNVNFHNPSLIHLGDYVHISYGCFFLATDHIWVSDEVMFGPYCCLSAGNHTYFNGSYRFGKPELKPIYIDKGSWLGAHIVVTAGSKIGKGVLVAAGAVVAGDIADNTIVGGIPANVIKTVIE